MLCHVTLVRTDISDEHSASIVGTTRIGELGTLAVTSNLCILQGNSISSQILVTLMMEHRSYKEDTL
jgi:hypothetical protein